MNENKLEEGVTCRGGIPKACYSKRSVDLEPTSEDVCKTNEGVKLKATKVTTYVVDPGSNDCKGLAGFKTGFKSLRLPTLSARLELKNVQCECPTPRACYKTVWNTQTSKHDKKVMVQMDSKSTATIVPKQTDGTDGPKRSLVEISSTILFPLWKRSFFRARWNRLDKRVWFDCYVAALQQVMDSELEASAKEQEKALSSHSLNIANRFNRAGALV